MRQYHTTGVSVQSVHTRHGSGDVRRIDADPRCRGGRVLSRATRSVARVLELSDESDLHDQLVTGLAPDLALGQLGKVEDVASRGTTDVDQKVRVLWRNLGPADAVTLQTDLVDQPPGTDSRDLLEHGPA